MVRVRVSDQQRLHIGNGTTELVQRLRGLRAAIHEHMIVTLDDEDVVLVVAFGECTSDAEEEDAQRTVV